VHEEFCVRCGAKARQCPPSLRRLAQSGRSGKG
jgi:hypothetical protein